MEFHRQHHEQQEEEDDEEHMPLPINSTYGDNNHIVPLSLHHHKPPFTDASTAVAPPPPAEVVVVKYKECLRNHAASMGGKARDGCGEFMPSGEEGSLEALTCAVCNCHRNFHRKEVEGDTHHHHHHHPHHRHVIPTATVVPPHLKRFDLGNGRNLILQESLGYNHNNNGGSLVPSRGPPPMIMPYNMGMGMGMGCFPSESEENGGGTGAGGYMNIYSPAPPLPAPPAASVDQQAGLKKRYRTKFTQEQKEKMFKFAENAGWKIQRQEESVVQEFCQEIGIKRRVLKVWMHNNKQNLAKNANSISIDPPQQHPN